MADLTPERGPDRRTLLRAGLLTGLGAAAITAPGLTGVARAALEQSAASPASGHPVIDFVVQQGWWWCSKCQGLFFSGTGIDTGVCWKTTPTTKHHVGSTTPYEVPNGNPAQSWVSDDWSWCNKCQMLWWGSADAGACPATPGNGHYYGSATNYDVLYGGWTGVSLGLQTGWRWCSTCEALFWGPNGDAGVCEEGVPHRADSDKLQLFID